MVLRKLRDFGGTITDNACVIPNYLEWRRCGEVAPTGFVEATANQVVAKRWAKKQQVQWTPLGIDLLLQLRICALVRTLSDNLKRWDQDRDVKPIDHAEAADP